MSASAPDAAPRERIDLRERADVDYWTRRLGLSPEELAAVVAIAGDRAADVVDYVKTQGRPTTPE